MKKLITFDDRIFIAGANGMVGNAVMKKLEKKGYGKIFKKGALLTPNRSALNLLNKNKVKDWFIQNKPTVVIICAAKVGGIYSNSLYPATFLLENIKIQTNIIESAWEIGVKRLLFLGSSCIYPKYSSQPIKEDYLLNGSLEPTNESYAIAKICGIKLCEALRYEFGFDAISLMPTNLYGPKDNYHPLNSHVMASLIKKICEAKIKKLNYITCWGNGSPLREFLHVDDLADAIIFALEYWDPNSDNSPMSDNGKPLSFLNVGTGKDISISNLANMISKIVEFNGEIKWDKDKPNGTPKKQLDITRIIKLGWKPKINLKDGIKSTIDSYLLDLKKS